jgi:hypothetical protein
MTTSNHRQPSPPDSERGSVTVLAAVLALALLACLALVVDGAGRLRALSRADAVAAEAARAALSALDTRGRTLRLEPAAATRAARGYLVRAGYPGTIHITGPTTVTVTVTIHHPAVLPVFGGAYTLTGHAAAQLGVGVHAGGQ